MGAFGGNIICYSPEEIHFSEPELYTNNLNVIAGQNSISPRLCTFWFMGAMLRCGLSYEVSCLVVIGVILLIMTLALTLFLYKTDLYKSERPYILLTLIIWIIFSRIGDFVGFDIYDPSCHFMGLGASLVLLGIVYALTGDTPRERNLSYILVALGACAHIHEGIWGFLIVSFVISYRFRWDIIKLYGLYLTIGVLLLIVLPPLLTSEKIYVQDFYSIYVSYRHPHHLLFAANIDEIVVNIVIYCLIYLFVKRSGDLYDAGLCLFLIFVFVFTMVVWYVTNDVLKISSFIELFIPKFVKYINAVFLFLLCKSLNNKDKWALALLILLIVYCLFRKNLFFYMLVPGIVLSILSVSFKGRMLRFLSLAYFSIMSIVVWSIPVIKNRDLDFSQAILANKVGRPVYDFSVKASKLIPSDKAFLINPKDSKGGYMQLVSRRDAYVTHKGVPSYEKAILEWYDRMMELDGVTDWDSQKLNSFMKGKKIDYFITQSIKGDYGHYFDVLLKEGKYILLKRKSTDDE